MKRIKRVLTLAFLWGIPVASPAFFRGEIKSDRNFSMRILIVYFFLLSSASVFSENSENEIRHLLDYVKDSEAQFIRNGKIYNSEKAAEHLLKKKEHFKKNIHSAEDFIRLTATKSLFTGESYSIRTADGTTAESAKWLMDALKRYRTKDKE